MRRCGVSANGLVGNPQPPLDTPQDRAGIETELGRVGRDDPLDFIPFRQPRKRALLKGIDHGDAGREAAGDLLLAHAGGTPHLGENNGELPVADVGRLANRANAKARGRPAPRRAAGLCSLIPCHFECRCSSFRRFAG